MRLLLGLFLMFAVAHAKAEDSSPPVVKDIGNGIFEIGKVRLDKNLRTLSFPATINMTNGLVEYLIVSAVGKLHESVLKTDVNPMHIHVGALLLGAKGAGTNLTVQEFDTREIPGEKIGLTVKWPEGEKRVEAATLIYNSEDKKPMPAGPWVYNGSQKHEGTFIAERDGLIVSIISDPLALVNNPRQGRANDEIWLVNSNAIPPMNTAVEFTMDFKTK